MIPKGIMRYLLVSVNNFFIDRLGQVVRVVPYDKVSARSHRILQEANVHVMSTSMCI